MDMREKITVSTRGYRSADCGEGLLVGARWRLRSCHQKGVLKTVGTMGIERAALGHLCFQAVATADFKCGNK